MKAGIKRFVPRKFSKRKDIEDIHDEEIDVSVDQGSESPGRSSPTSSSTGHPVTPEVSVLPQTLDMPSADITIQGEKNLKSHLNDVKKSLGEIMGSPYKKSQEIVEADEQVPLHHVRKLTDTVVDMLRAMSKKEGEVYLDKSVLPQQQAARYLSSDADEKASLSSGTTSSIKDSEISVKTELLKAQFLPQPQYEGDDVLPFYMDNDSVEACPTFTESIPKSLKKNVKINWPGLVIYIVYIIAFIIYIGIRSAKTLDLGSSLWYGIIVLMSEILGAFAVLPYGLCLVFKVVDPVPEAVTRALNGLPAQTSLSYHIRVLIPCYKEPLDVISKTFLASMFAALPVNCKRTIYLLDDGKDPEKRAFVRSLNMPNAVYISGRKREKGEMNGKSNNINNAMRHIYPGEDLEIPINEIVCVFDADQVPNADFFSKTVPLLDGGEDVAMILTPQAFSNLNHDGDIFNHANVHFWDYTQPGYDALGLISCTGTNFLIRARAFQDCGWFPDWTLTEDFALGIELKRRKWQCRYVDEYLALGEAPDEIRNCFQQRSRWAKGHFQLFSNPKRNPTFGKGAEGLSLLMRWMYGSVALSYFSAFIGTPLLMLVPLVTVWFGVFPIVINIWCAIAVTIYYPATMMVMYYTRSLGHLKSMWFAAVANSILWWAFLKAMYRATIGKWFAGTIVFKVTAKGLQKLNNLPIRDLWMATLWFLFSIVSLIFGLITYIKGEVTDTPLAISIIFIAYNMIPLYLLIQYACFRGPLVYNLICKIMMFVSTFLSLLGVVLVWLLYPRAYNYSDALGNSLFFLDSQRLGPLPDDFRVSWRQSAYLGESSTPVYLATNINDTLLLDTLAMDTFGGIDAFGTFGRKLMQADAADAFAEAVDALLDPTSAASEPSDSSIVDPFDVSDNLPEVATGPVSTTGTTSPSDPFAVEAGDTLGSGALSDPFGSSSGGLSDPFGSSIGGLSDPFGSSSGGLSDPFGSSSGALSDPFGSSSGGLSDPFGSSSGDLSDPFGDFGMDPFGSSSGGLGLSADPFANPTDAFGDISLGNLDGLGGGFGGFGTIDPFASAEAEQLKLATSDPWDLSGGWVTGMQGGNIKSTSPIAFATSVLSWGYFGFKDAFADSGQKESLFNSVKVGSDYLMKVHKRVPASNQSLIVSRVGDVEKEPERWYRPEDGGPREAYAVDLFSKEGGYGADLGGSVSAALAAAAALFEETEAEYSAALLQKSKEIYDDSIGAKFRFNRADYNMSELYNSSSMYDDLAWAAGWLYKATKEQRYLEDVYSHYIEYLEEEGPASAWKYAFDWDNVFWPLNILMAQETGNSTFMKQSEDYLKNWMCANNAANYTRRGRAYNAFSAPLGSTANIAMSAFMFADLIEEESASKSQAYRCWGLSQIRYMMGDAGRSMVIGQGHNPPKRSQDRGAACPERPNVCNRVTSYLSPDPDTHVLKGALVHGPAKSDYYIDERTNDASMVGIETNVGFTGALAGAATLPSGMWEICLQQFGIYRDDPICGSFVTL